MAKIRNLEQLAKEKQKVRLKLEVSKLEFTDSLANIKSESKVFLIKKVAIPAGIAGLTSIVGLGISKTVAANKRKKQARNNAIAYAAAVPLEAKKPKESFFSKWQDLIVKLLPIGIQLLQSYFVGEVLNNEDE